MRQPRTTTATVPVTIFATAGLMVEIHSEVPRMERAILSASGGEGETTRAGSTTGDVSLSFEATQNRFDTTGAELMTRQVWARHPDEVILGDVGGSGYSQRWLLGSNHLRVESRWTPTAKARLAAALLPARFRALQSQVLLHYPVLWWNACRGRVPLHVSVVEVEGVAVVLAGPGGVGKSTLVSQELRSGAHATCDNLAVSGGDVFHGLGEPLRNDHGSSGRRTTHGRREQPWTGRAPRLDPQLLVVLRRGPDSAGARRVEPEIASRALAAGTYAAGELQRFWPLCGVLAHTTGHGPVHPPVEAVADRLCSRLPCYELAIEGQQGKSLATLLSEPLLALRHAGEVLT